MRVPLVEDNGDLALPCRQALAALRGVPQTAASAQDACDWLRANPDGRDLVVVDLFLGRATAANRPVAAASCLPRATTAGPQHRMAEPG